MSSVLSATVIYNVLEGLRSHFIEKGFLPRQTLSCVDRTEIATMLHNRFGQNACPFVVEGMRAIRQNDLADQLEHRYGVKGPCMKAAIIDKLDELITDQLRELKGQLCTPNSYDNLRLQRGIVEKIDATHELAEAVVSTHTDFAYATVTSHINELFANCTAIPETGTTGDHTGYHDWDRNKVGSVLTDLGVSDLGVAALLSAGVVGRSLPHISRDDLVKAKLTMLDCSKVMKLVDDVVAVRAAESRRGKGFLSRAEVFDWDTKRLNDFVLAWTDSKALSQALSDNGINGKTMGDLDKDTLAQYLKDGLLAAAAVRCLDMFQRMNE